MPTKPKKPDAPMMLASVEQAVRTLREWGWDVRPRMGKRGSYVASKPRVAYHGGIPREEFIDVIIRSGKSMRDRAFTGAGEAILECMLIDIRRHSVVSSLDKLAEAFALNFNIAMHTGAVRHDTAFYLSRILRDAFPDVADLLEVHAHGGSL